MISTPSPKRIQVATCLLSLLVYSVLVGVNFDPKVQEVQAKAFGPNPFGMRPPLGAIIVESLLYIPIPVVLAHVIRLWIQAFKDGSRVNLSYLFSVGRRQPSLRRSQWICLAGLIYFCVLCGIWIVYADSLGI